ncbi:glutaredoxin domain-containing protein [Rhodococcoides fascians]|uniref:glutaredoxin domain-containing protein n=1 Tax=Rhodococcoides fascians TaxID=1828 RepID=UPI0009B8C81E|nr:glutaredoxin domain-containing protein [Rhodococcus fascians]
MTQQLTELDGANTSPTGVEVYWMPGCTSCLRMKEFIEKAGVQYESINVDEEPERGKKLQKHNLILPAACIGDRCVNGVDLGAVADLIGVEYEAPVILPPEELINRYRLISDSLIRYIKQMTPEVIDYYLPGRDRPMIFVASHAAYLARIFLTAYYDDKYDAMHTYLIHEKINAKKSPDIALDLAAETRKMLDEWWEIDGVDDPMERVVETYWGHRTLHEVLEREVWHTTQHTRQVQYALEECGITPDGPITAAQLAGLPLPERIHD